MAFYDLEDNMNLAESFIKYIIRYTVQKNAEDLAFLDQRLAEEEKQKPQNERSGMSLMDKLNFVLDNDFERVTYTEAIQLLLDSPAYKKRNSSMTLSGVSICKANTNAGWLSNILRSP
jgi:asparaginyl-tRNA synthetase